MKWKFSGKIEVEKNLREALIQKIKEGGLHTVCID